MTNLLASRTGAQDRIIPASFREKFRGMGFRVGTAPEGLPLVEEPMMLDDLHADPAPESSAPARDDKKKREATGQLICLQCGKECKSGRGLTQHMKAAHDA